MLETVAWVDDRLKYGDFLDQMENFTQSQRENWLDLSYESEKFWMPVIDYQDATNIEVGEF